MSDQLQTAIADYHALIADDLTAAEEQLAALMSKQVEGNVTFGDRPMANSLRPTFLTERTYNAVQDTVYLIRQALLTIAANFFNNTQVLKEELAMEDWEIELASIPTNVIRLSVFSRMDSFLTKTSFKFVEINAESPAGIAYIHELGRIYRELPIFKTFEKKHPVRFVSPMEHTLAAMLQIYHEQFDGKQERPTIAIVDHLDVPTIHEFRLLKQYFERMGFPTEIIDPRALECHDGWIYANGRKIDILYRRLLMNEFYAIKDDCQPFLEGYLAQKTCYLNTFRTKLVHKKAIFAFLTDEKYTHVLSREQQEAIREHIPWTRMLREQNTTFRGLKIDLLEFVRANRKYFVIKPNDEYGGKGVTLGFAASQEEWETAIAASFEGDYVVQECVDIHREPFLVKAGSSWEMVPTIIDLDPYLNGPLMGGCLTRTSASNLANVTAGGGTLPMFILRYTYDDPYVRFAE
ncbi:MAG TPA: circularly permuted type 2 ATP-grasp protein [Rhodothermales bacterium]|nr:circularly permuted type 2 ATP-grasp protein [Rhodothermales bacterium]